MSTKRWTCTTCGGSGPCYRKRLSVKKTCAQFACCCCLNAHHAIHMPLCRARGLPKRCARTTRTQPCGMTLFPKISLLRGHPLKTFGSVSARGVEHASFCRPRDRAVDLNSCRFEESSGAPILNHKTHSNRVYVSIVHARNYYVASCYVPSHENGGRHQPAAHTCMLYVQFEQNFFTRRSFQMNFGSSCPCRGTLFALSVVPHRVHI